MIKFAVILTGYILGYISYLLFYRRKNNKIHQYRENLLVEAQEKSRTIIQEQSKKAKREKEELEASVQRTLEEIYANNDFLQTSLKNQEIDLQLWEQKLVRIEQKIENYQNDNICYLEKIAEKEQEFNKICHSIYHDLVDHTKANPMSITKTWLDNLREEVTLETKLQTTKYLDDLMRRATNMGTRVLSTVIQRYRISHRVDINPSIVEWEDNGQNSLEYLVEIFHNKLDVDILFYEAPTPHLSLYSMDGYKREIARRSLEKIIKTEDKTLNVNDIIDQTFEQLQEEIIETGQKASRLFEQSFDRKLYCLLGRLKYRTSFGQNVLEHSLEVAYLAKLLAMELGLDSEIACCAGLLHDIGKAIDQEQEGGHAEIGGKILEQYDFVSEIIEGVARHHEDIQPGTPYATIISAADAISASRPGARRETFEIYIKRLENLEAIAQKIEGVDNAFAISAGRELRVMVNPEQVSDEKAGEIAVQIARDIEKELHYPGKIKITVIRELKTEQYVR